MNDLEYSILKKLQEKRSSNDILNDVVVEELCSEFFDKARILRITDNISLTKEEFKKIIISIYSVLPIKLSKKKDIKKLSQNYIMLLLADAIDDWNIDKDWAINHLWYLSMGRENIKKDDLFPLIVYMQKKLLKEFNIKEKITDKTKRKVATWMLTK